MGYRKLISLILAILMLLSTTSAWAEGSALNSQESTVRGSESVYYKGGVVERSKPRGAASDEIQVAYSLTDMPYIVLGRDYEWDVFVTGGKAPYTIAATPFWQETEKDPFNNSWWGIDYIVLKDSSVEYTFTDAGRYFWEFEVSDSLGETVVFQTRIYEAYTEADETDVTTTVGKANSIVDSLITDSMSDYSRARVLHDWIIHNANYDDTRTHYDASGVLLYGTGVCDSYARAYLMLCTAAGLDCMYVSGTAGHEADPADWGNHGWNLVRLDGSWYHVDCTWDDPGSGGYERHTYFCVDDETMAKDHRWNRADDIFDEGMIIPPAEGGKYEPSEEEALSYDFTFTTWDEFDEEFDRFVASGERRDKTYGLYVGTEDAAVMYQSMGQWSSAKTNELYYAGLSNGGGRGHKGNLFYYIANWFKPTGYLRISENSLILSADETAQITVSEMYPVANSFTWTSSDPSVAAASATFDADNSVLIVSVRGVGAGTATITGTAPDGHSDSLTVTVTAPYAPEMNVYCLDSEDGPTVYWDSVPGATEYELIKSVGGKAYSFGAIDDTSISLSSEQLSANEVNELWVIARRKVGGSVMATYESEHISYGSLSVQYTSALPSGTVHIKDEAFLNNKSLTSLIIPSGAKSIGRAAFSGCTALTAVRIPATVTEIGDGAFDGCPLVYAEVEEGSLADLWMQEHHSDVTLLYD